MSEPTITVQVADDGGLSLDAAGYAGPACQEATAALLRHLQEAGLELDLIARQLKPEYALEPAAEHRAQLQRIGPR